MLFSRNRRPAPGVRGLAVRNARSARPSLLVVLLLPLLFASGCISEEREREIGDSLAADVNPHLPLVEDPLLNAYVRALGNQIVDVSDRPEVEYRFYLINTDAVNAFALPGGHVYVTRGLIAETGDGAEFAGVLAHEIAHVAARHGVRRLQREMRTGSLVSILYDIFLGGEPEVLRENSLEIANEYLAARYSRQDEKEADRLAVDYLNRAGIDPQGMVSLLETLVEHEQNEKLQAGPLAEWFSTHPMTSERLAEARQDVDQMDPRGRVPDPASLEAFPAFQMLVMRLGGHLSVPD